jgi:hypothetical protein
MSTKYIRSILVNGGILLKTGNIFENSAYAGVGQDKGTPQRTDKASSEAQNASSQAYRPLQPKHHGSQKRRLKELSGCVEIAVFDQVERMRIQWARERGLSEQLSRSEVVGALVARGVQAHIDMQYGTLLEPIIKKVIKEQIQGITNRAVYIAVQAFYSAEESRIINTKVLSYLFGQETEMYTQVVKDAREEARNNITKPMEDKYAVSSNLWP